jgi:cytochrome c biogenesis protein CcdA
MEEVSMEERFVPAAQAESRPIGASNEEGQAAGSRPIEDPRALQILSTEHWSLLTARSLVYNEAFARAGMFLAFLSATLLVLGLISTATGFSDGFLVIAAVLLALDLFIGLATIGRINAAGEEDIRYLQGMNRLRNAYHDMVPGLEGYFITSKYDDLDSTLMMYGPPDTSIDNASNFRAILHGFTTAPVMIAVIVCAVVGALTAVLVLLATHDAVVAGISGGAGFVIAFVIAVVVSLGAVESFAKHIEVKFPAPPREKSREP